MTPYGVSGNEIENLNHQIRVSELEKSRFPDCERVKGGRFNMERGRPYGTQRACDSRLKLQQ